MGLQGDPRLDCQSTANGLVLRSCANIQALLAAAQRSPALPKELRDAAVQHLDAPVIPYPVVRDVWVQLAPGYGVPFHEVLAGSSFVLDGPKPREKSKELKERLAKLQELAEKKAYSELVKDVTKREDREYFSSYRNSLGFGIHVLFIMFTGYMFGYAIVRSQFPDSASLHAAGGVLGMIVGMLVESLLFITRTSMAEKSFDRKAKAEMKVGKAGSTDAPAIPIESEETIPVSEIQAEPETALGVRKRRGLVQLPG